MTFRPKRDANGSEFPALRRHGQNERMMALNRKNALFAGHDVGAQNWAVIASLIETCKLNGVDPHAWLSATLTAIVQSHQHRQIEDLLPWNFVPVEDHDKTTTP